MNTTLKNTLYVAGGALVFSSIVGFKKVSKIKTIFDAMEIKPDSYSKFDFNLSEAKIRFNLNVLLSNKTNEDLYVTGVSVATLKQIQLYYKGAFIGTANVNISEISIPANKLLLIKNIPIEVQAVNVLQNIKSLINFDINLLTVNGIIEVLGITYVIGEN